jgi:hypothetical protein
MEWRWERQDSKKGHLHCNKEQMEEKYYNVGRNEQKNPEDDYKGIQYGNCHYSMIQMRMLKMEKRMTFITTCEK